MTSAQLLKRSRTARLRRLSVRVVLASCVLGLGILPASACAKAQARTNPDSPPLDMPAPPPRVLAPADEPIVAAPAEPAEPAPAPPSTNRRPAPRRIPADPAQKPETTPPVEPVASPVSPPPQETRPVEPQPTLRAPGGVAEKPIRDRIIGAQRDLARVDYARLSQDGKSQYEQSKRFIQQAEQALKDQNLVFAQTLADKAAVLAAELLGR